MESTPQVAPEPQAPNPPFAHCRYCAGAIRRNEQVAFFPRSKKVAHLRCADRAGVL